MGYEKLFLEKRELVYRYLFSLCRDPVLAEELTQETFFRAYINFGSLRNREKAGVWLCSIGKNCFYAWCREQKRVQPQEVPKTESVSVDPEKVYIDGEAYKALHDCINALEEPYGQVLKSRVVDGLSLQEISRIYGKSESWARVTFYRAKEKLKERMKHGNEL